METFQRKRTSGSFAAATSTPGQTIALSRGTTLPDGGSPDTVNSFSAGSSTVTVTDTPINLRGSRPAGLDRPTGEAASPALVEGNRDRIVLTDIKPELLGTLSTN